ncbi:MAG TPA: COX15/CtaA family protein, partial [Cyanobium sp.]|nr:COX15/CtaA family protein [Cyanobium sp.]
MASPSSPLPPGLSRALEFLTAHLVVALVALVAIGGATRVMEAGLACPDWPLCYGVLLPGRQMNLQVFLEWFHRLDAFLVGLALLVLSALSLRFRACLPRWLPAAAFAGLLLVALQGGLGALTVTRLLAAPMVSAHLITALVLVLLLSATHQRLISWLAVRDGKAVAAPVPSWWLALVLLAVVLVLVQCLLGGLMASQWAAERCFASGEGCRWLSLHRQGAWLAALGPLALAIGALALPPGHPWLRGLAGAGVVLVLLQVGLGVLTLRLQLSLPAVTVGHQLVAALLVAVIGGLAGASFSTQPLPTSSQ